MYKSPSMALCKQIINGDKHGMIGGYHVGQSLPSVAARIQVR